MLLLGVLLVPWLMVRTASSQGVAAGRVLRIEISRHVLVCLTQGCATFVQFADPFDILLAYARVGVALKALYCPPEQCEQVRHGVDVRICKMPTNDVVGHAPALGG